MGATGPTGAAGTAGATGPTGPTGVAGVAPLIAAARVDVNGAFVSQQGFSGIAHTPASGTYALTLANPPASLDDLSVQVTQVNFDGSGEQLVDFTDPDVIEVFTFDSTGTISDRPFMVAVFDLT